MSGTDPPSRCKKDRETRGTVEESPSTGNCVAPVKRAEAYGGPLQPPDCEHWGKMPVWTVFEFSALTLGYDPAPIQKDIEAARKHNASAVERIWKRCDLTKRQLAAEGEAETLVPVQGMRWLQLIGEPFPSQLSEIVERIGAIELPLIGAKGSWTDVMHKIESVRASVDALPSEPSGAALTHLYHSLLKTALIMAVEKFGHDPDKYRSPAPSRISKAAEKYSLKVDDGTLRSQLQKAAEIHWLGPFD